MKILLIGECYSKNLGDPILCHTVRNSIKKTYPDAEIVMFDMSGKTGYSTYYEYSPEEYTTLHKVVFKLSTYMPFLFRGSKLYRAYVKDEIRYIRVLYSLDHILKNDKFEIAIFAGGSLFMDYFAGLIYCIVRKIARYRTSIVFHACGMSTINEDSIKLLRAALRNKYVSSVSLRDSFEKFNRLFKIKALVTETYDTALSCSEYYSSADKKRADIGIGLMRSKEYDGFQREIIEYMMKSSLSWKIFTNGADQRKVLDFLSTLGMTAVEIEKRVEPCPQTAEELIELITSFNKVMSLRMHGNIVAASYGIPCFGFVWDEKVKEFFNKMGLHKSYVEPDEEFDINLIFERMNEVMPDLRAQAQRQGAESQKELIRAIERALS